MSYNGSGTFVINSTGQPVVTGTVISSTAFNALTADLGTGLSTAITKDGQTATTARIPFAQGISSTLVTDSTSTTTGSIITAGGVGIAKALFVGTTANVAGAVTLQSTLGVTGVTTVQAGTAALPAITTAGDTNTGIFFPAADTIAFAEGGAEAMRIDSSGNVGIGTSSPAYKLDVTGAINATNTSNTTVASAGFDAATSWGLGIANASTTAGTGAGIYFLGGTNSESYIGNLYESSGAGALSFQTRVGGDRAERMRIDSSGNLLVGATSPSVTSSFQVKRSGGNPVTVHNNGGTSGYFNQILFLNNAGTADIGYINRVNDSSVQYVTSSDYRLKNTVSPMTGALAKVALLKPVTYKWNADGSDSQGFIAHELAEVVPDCVSGEKDAVDADGNPKYQGIDTSFLVATLTAAIQEQQALITALTTRITALEAA